MKILPLCDTVTYVLKLKNNNYYVGKTTDLHKRLSSHFFGSGSAWTNLHSPVSVVSVHAFDREEELTIRAMKAFGVDHVRGHRLSACELSAQGRNLKAQFERLVTKDVPKTWKTLHDRTR
jgi:predicted GIY-YIG superfamily endonuclease